MGTVLPFSRHLLDGSRNFAKQTSRWTLVILTGLLAIPNWAKASSEANDSCARAAQFAAHEIGVPNTVMLAIAKTETGREVDGVIQPWPWAINVAGKGSWLATEADLLEQALSLISKGERRFDVGCFQLNYHWHSEGFDSLDEMISPRGNALYAAKFLKSLYSEFGDWSDAAGAYHSRTATLAKSYKTKFLRHYQEPSEPEKVALSAQASTRKPRENHYPLLVAKPATSRLGSLVPGVSQ